MKTLATTLSVCLLSCAVFAQTLTWAQLTGRPELWPTQCTVKTAMKFAGGASVREGQTVNVRQFKANEVELATTDGKVFFAAEQDETDVLNRADEDFAKLTPKQRALTYPAIARQQELWPCQVTITREFTLAPGKNVKIGDLVLVKDVQPDRVDVVSTNLSARFAVTTAATDLMPQVRRFIEDPTAGPRLMAVQKAQQEKILAEEKAEAEHIAAIGKLPVELKGKLINSMTGQPEPLDTNSLPRYFVFLRGQSSCPITRNFAPSLVRYCKSIKTTHPEVQVIYLTVESLPDTFKFTRELGFDCRAISYDNSYMPSVNPHIDGRLPQLIVMDRNGKVLADGIQSTAPAALQQLQTLVASGK
jgi:hypothetical protein